jgi:hypothetical protein
MQLSAAATLNPINAKSGRHLCHPLFAFSIFHTIAYGTSIMVAPAYFAFPDVWK